MGVKSPATANHSRRIVVSWATQRGGEERREEKRRDEKRGEDRGDRTCEGTFQDPF